jgi:anti-sigma-K factor RskA
VPVNHDTKETLMATPTTPADAARQAVELLGPFEADPDVAAALTALRAADGDADVEKALERTQARLAELRKSDDSPANEVEWLAKRERALQQAVLARNSAGGYDAWRQSARKAGRVVA